MEVIQLDKFIKQNKLMFKPDFLISVLTRFNKIKGSMVQKIALKKSNESEECKYCDAVKSASNSAQLYCKKHKSIHDWEKMDPDRTGVGNLFGHQIQIFGRYVIASMPTDNKGVYVIWIGDKEEDYSVYCMSKDYFPEVFERGFNINELLNENNVVVYKNVQVYWEDNNPRLESIK